MNFLRSFSHYFSVLIFLWPLILSKALFGQHADLHVSVNTAKAIHQIDPNFWGANFLYWIEDDSALADGKILNDLKKANVKLLRYPGGTVADNFHWRTATLDNTNMFPYESGAAETDFDEFMAACKKVGADASCVLNVESWFARNDVAGGAHEAAEWLRYCKRKGYKVKYWEIGNETYWHPVLTAEEYASVANQYADSMRGVDSGVVLGINGHWDVHFVGTKERIPGEKQAELKKLRKNIQSRQQYNAYNDYKEKHTQKPITKGNKKWWETLARLCGSKIDMIVIHWYFGDRQLPDVSKKLLEVRALFKEYHPQKDYIFNMSEFNTVSNSKKGVTELTEMFGEMLKGKIDVSNLWPLRLRIRKPMLFKYPSTNTTDFYEVYQKLASSVKGSLVEATLPAGINGFASSHKHSCTVVMSGRMLKNSQRVALTISGGRYKTCNLFRMAGGEGSYRSSGEKQAVRENQLSVTLDPDDIVIAVFN